MDPAKAYLQLEVDEDCKDFTTINTHRVDYHYNRMAFGIASAPDPSHASPLHNLHEDTTWKWTKECQEAARQESWPVTLVRDDLYGLGAAIFIDIQITDSTKALLSRSLAPAEKKITQIDKEALGIIWGIKKLHSYLKGYQLQHQSACKDIHFSCQDMNMRLNSRGTAKHAKQRPLSRLPPKSTEVDTCR
ncbi:unnamed protein product [Mytilus coruscus]|uniref:Reverse transcriptase/retrotransposon-derived protein RNase H-like domain-containing protein n=1 Tax=Mytilus coruscus TaxID=42192 RepID=A0A6J8B590_MYTCO|nr:unnamed protein product [Mytilus coruscus]